MKRKYKLVKPTFVISLDFELMWGVFDKRTIRGYGNNVNGVHSVVPGMLALFKEYNIHVTWAAVGCLYYTELAKLKADLPVVKPQYSNKRYSAYSHVNTIDNVDFITYYSGLHLIEQIIETPGQEIGTHTFSHYYCLEEGQTIDSFRADIKKSIEKSKQFGLEIRSIIFPRNQYDNSYLKVCREEGILAYRGNEINFIQKPRGQKKLNVFIRALRFADTYINITGMNVYRELEINDSGLVNVPASFFFRPFRKNSGILEYLKLKRYKKAMLTAARSGSLFHLWWHPHNFGSHQTENLAQLKEILDYYTILNKKFGMQSLHMGEVAEQVTS